MSLNDVIGRFTRAYFKSLCNSQFVIFLCKPRLFQIILSAFTMPRITSTKIVFDKKDIVKFFFMSLPIIGSCLENNSANPDISLRKISFEPILNYNPKKIVEIIRLLPLFPDDKLLTIEITSKLLKRSPEQVVCFENLSISAIFKKSQPFETKNQKTIHLDKQTFYQKISNIPSISPYYSTLARNFIKSFPPGSVFICVSFMGDTDLNQQLLSNQDYVSFLNDILEISLKIYTIVFDPGFVTDSITCDNSRILYSKQYGWSLIEEMAIISCSDIFFGNSNIYGAAAKQFNSAGLIFFEEEDQWYNLKNLKGTPYKNGIRFNGEEFKEIICNYLRY